MHRLFNLTSVVLLLTTQLFAQQPPKVKSLSAIKTDDSLVVNFELAELFSPKITNTIQSGLPAIIRYDFRVTNQFGKDAERQVHQIKVVYDLWAQRYRITLDDSTYFAQSFEDMQRLCSYFRNHPIISLTSLDSSAVFRVRLQVAVLPISSRLGKQFRDRIESVDLRDEPAASESGRSGFSVNVSRLISFFIGEKERIYGVSDWATSPPFRVKDKP